MSFSSVASLNPPSAERAGSERDDTALLPALSVPPPQDETGLHRRDVVQTPPQAALADPGEPFPSHTHGVLVMSSRVKALVSAIRSAVVIPVVWSLQTAGAAAAGVSRRRGPLLAVAGAGVAIYLLIGHTPVQTIGRGEMGIRINQLTGGTSELHEGSSLVIPGIHVLHRYSLKDQIYRPLESSKALGASPFQSVEGLSIGVDLAIRYAIDPTKVAQMSNNLPEDINGEVVEPAVQGVIFKIFTRYTVREIFSSKRAEIQKAIEDELRPRLLADGIHLRSVQMGNVDLPADYRVGMERLLEQELETEKMRYTLDLKEKQVHQTELEGEADKVRRQKAAEAAGDEQIIAARAQEEAMKHVLPFKQKQIEQRQLEAEAEKVSRIKTAEGNAQARVIEAGGEADSREKLADAEVYRMERLGKTTSEQMAREGELLSKHPLLIQKTLADKLSDKVSVIIAPAPTDGSFIGKGLLGSAMTKTAVVDGEPDDPAEVQ